MPRSHNKPIPKLSPKDTARFWSRVAVKGPDECWLWTAWTDDGGYGRMQIRNKSYLASRISYFLANQDPGESECRHSCDNPSCCNPSHISIGNHQDNMTDMKSRGRGSAPRGNDHWTRKNPDRLKGERHPGSKITQADADRIRHLLNMGVLKSDKEWAAIFGISYSTLRMIINGQAWNR